MVSFWSLRFKYLCWEHCSPLYLFYTFCSCWNYPPSGAKIWDKFKLWEFLESCVKRDKHGHLVEGGLLGWLLPESNAWNMRWIDYWKKICSLSKADFQRSVRGDKTLSEIFQTKLTKQNWPGRQWLLRFLFSFSDVRVIPMLKDVLWLGLREGREI